MRGRTLPHACFLIEVPPLLRLLLAWGRLLVCYEFWKSRIHSRALRCCLILTSNRWCHILAIWCSGLENLIFITLHRFGAQTQWARFLDSINIGEVDAWRKLSFNLIRDWVLLLNGLPLAHHLNQRVREAYVIHGRYVLKLFILPTWWARTANTISKVKRVTFSLEHGCFLKMGDLLGSILIL